MRFQRLYIVAVSVVVMALFASCSSKNGDSTKKPLTPAPHQNDNGVVNVWGETQVKDAHDLCVSDLQRGNKTVTPVVARNFCDCLIDKAQSTMKAIEYLNYPHMARDKQGKAGDIDSCSKEANLDLRINRKFTSPGLMYKHDAIDTNLVVLDTGANSRMTFFGILQDKILNLAVSAFKDGKWQTPHLLGLEMEHDPIVGKSNKGHLVLLLADFPPPPADPSVPPPGAILRAVRHDPVTGWQKPEQINNPPQGGILYVGGAVADNNGNMLVAWDQASGDFSAPEKTTYEVYSRRFANGKWEPEVKVDSCNCSNPVLKMDSLGRSYLIIREYNTAANTSGYKILTTPTAAGPWEMLPSIPIPVGVEKWRFDLVNFTFDGANNIHVFTSAFDLVSKNSVFYMNSYNPATRTWTQPKLVNIPKMSYVKFLDVQKAPNGDIYAVYTLDEQVSMLVWVIRYNPKTGEMEKPFVIDHNVNDLSYRPVLAMDQNSPGIMVAFVKSKMDDDFQKIVSSSIWASYFNGFYWQEEVLISSPEDGDTVQVGSVLFDGNSNASIYWRQGQGTDWLKDGSFFSDFK